jgi:hypothetical protein
MECDICSESGSGTLVTASEMRKAINSGFDSFQLRLTDDMGLDNYMRDSWRNQALAQNSGWNLSAKFMAPPVIMSLT